MYTIPFQNASQYEKSVGAKAKNLSILLNHQLPVPDGFVVAMDALSRTLQANRLDLKKPRDLERKLPAIDIPDDVKEEIKANFDRLLESYDAVAVRSSSAAEDLEGASFAGQYETYLNVTTFEELLAKLKACWASMFTAQVFQYLDKMNIALADLSMGVAVQGMVYSEVSGVMFSANPITKNPHEVVINASYGLGEAIVSGIATPDLYIVKKENDHIEKELGLKEVKMLAGVTGTTTVDTTEEERNQYCLSDRDVLKLAEIAKRVERIYGHPVDMEFGMQKGAIYLLQARPITTTVSEFQWSIILNEEDKKDKFWFYNEDHIAGAKSPLFASFIVPAFNHGFNAAFGRMHFPLGESQTKVHLGHIYQSMTPFTGDMEEQLAKHQEFMRPLFPIIKKRLYEAIEKELMPHYEKLDQDSQAELTLDEALRKVDELFQFYHKAWEVHFDVVGPYGAIMQLLEKLHEQLTNKKDPLFLHELLVGVMNKSLETDRELWKLAEQAKQNPVVLNEFTHVPADRLAARLAATEEGSAFLAAVKNMMSEYGYNKTNTHEFLGQTWIEDMSVPLSHIQAFIKTGYNFDEEYARMVKEREQKYAECIQSLPDSERKRQFMQVYDWALAGKCVHDDHHFYIDAMLSAKARLFLLNVGKTMVKHGIVTDKEDIFYLYLDELKHALANPKELKPLIAERKAEFAENRQKRVPSHFGTPPKELLAHPHLAGMLGSLEESEEAENQTIKGFAAARGTYTGKVKVIRNEEEFSKLEKGDVLVCQTTTPSWTFLFPVASAIITDAGGILSHSGIIAREYKLPAVLGTKVATSRLKDGDVVTVDGDNGMVIIHESE
ncbi:PEP/pyruvate-binding domain-containing protein [Laceyella putida]|uniref:PEP/pyruvate-binding domain-containing protein n=1 Tax=Laceyella putida TaxID=110101 RepID=A0ABW2RL45_9BACL